RRCRRLLRGGTWLERWLRRIANGALDEDRPRSDDRERLVRRRRWIVDPVEEVPKDVPRGSRHGQGEDRAEQAADRPANDQRDHHDRRMELDGIALDLRDED